LSCGQGPIESHSMGIVIYGGYPLIYDHDGDAAPHT
jgi:hypothetical protein